MSRRSARITDPRLEPEEQQEEQQGAGRMVGGGGGDVEEQGRQEQEVTRCVCGHEEYQGGELGDSGFFLSCDACHVWQHGVCVGIPSEQLAPEVYYCEECRPDLHRLAKSGTHSLYSGPTPITPPPPPRARETSQKREEQSLPRNTTPGASSSFASPPLKRRSTLNSRDADYEEILQQVLQQSAQEDEVHGEHQEVKRRDRGSDRTEDQMPDYSPRANSSENEVAVIDDDDKTVPVKKEEFTERGHEDQESAEEEDPQAEGSTAASMQAGVKRKPRRKGVRRGGRRPGMKRAVDEPREEEARGVGRKKRKRNESANASNAAPEERERPSKPRFPQARASMGEMRKRVAAILEFITRTQIEMAAGIPSPDAGSAPHKSLECMDELTRELLSWEREFGRYGAR